MPGGGGGGGGSQNTMQTTNNTTGPNPAIAPHLRTLVGGAWDHIDQNWRAPGYFPGGTVAPQSDRTNIANTALWQLGSNNLADPNSDANTGRRFVDETLSGKYLDANSNPAYQGWLEASFRPQAEQFRDIIAPGMDSKFAGSGRTGGGAHFDTNMRGYQDLARSQSDAAAKSALGLYQGERANQFSAAGMLPSFQGMDYQNMAAMQQSGQNVDAYNQRLLDDQNAKYGYDQTKQLDWYNRLSQTLQSMYPGGTTQGQSTGTGTSAGGGGGGDGGQGMQLAGAGIAAAGTIAAAFI